MKKFIVLLLSLTAGFAFITFFSTSVCAFEIGVRGYYWFPTLKSNVKVDSSAVSGTEFNVKDNLGIGLKPYPSVEVFGGLGKNHVSLMYTEADSSESTKLSQTIAFNGTTFPAGTQIDSHFKIRMIDLAYKRDLVDMENILAGFSFSVIGKLKYTEGDVSMNSGGTQASEKVRFPVPMVGVGAHIGILAKILEARAEITGIAYSSNYLYEALADLSLTPFPFIDIHGGYKIIGVRVDRDDVYFNSEFTGPYAALTVSF